MNTKDLITEILQRHHPELLNEEFPKRLEYVHKGGVRNRGTIANTNEPSYVKVKDCNFVYEDVINLSPDMTALEMRKLIDLAMEAAKEATKTFKTVDFVCVLTQRPATYSRQDLELRIQAKLYE